ncbi:MAG: endonuclease [Bacteroidales bacterium]|nr:endonuclease [Bacteroidales bacterium]
MTPLASQSQEFSTFTAAWWNVENLFDLRDDPETNDDEFTPQGDLHWTRRKLNAKIEGIYKTLTMMDLPDVVGMAEVENNYVLRELCQNTPLVQVPYRYVHYDSPDRRGIDVALIYRTDRFRVTASRAVNVSDSAADFFTRDILLVEGITAAGDSVVLLLNHWPSKRGGDEAEMHRIEVARTLRSLMNEQRALHPQAAIIAMGDMNSTISEAPLTEGMGFGADSVNPDGIRNLTHRLPKDWGSHKYQGLWDYIDQVFLLADGSWLVADLKLKRFDHLLAEEKNKPGMRPRRTYVGPKYEGGLSDHLPLLLRLKRKKN